jgi:lysozyme family protein
MTDIAALKAEEARLWSAMHILPERKPLFMRAAKRLVAPTAKARYQFVSRQTGVPWYVIAVIHEREASQDWNANIAQGDRFDRVSIHVPKGRGPFSTWEAAACDALRSCAPYAARWTDWSIEGTLTLLETYNGTGYFARHLPSPYDWSGTDQYHAGKFIRDGVFSSTAVDTQLGCAALLACMAELDPDVKFTKPDLPVKPLPPTPVSRQPWWLVLLQAIIKALRK